MIQRYCIIGRKTLPALPCNYNTCPWYVVGEDYANCFWVVAEVMALCCLSFSECEIAEFEDTTVDEIGKTLVEAMQKIRFKHGRYLTELS